MCVIAFAWDCQPRWKLLLVGNRDELHARPSAPLAHWGDVPGVLAGRDLEAGGTWMGVREPERAAVVTNVRDPQAGMDGASRGLLVSDYLAGPAGAMAQAIGLARSAERYRPFNLLLFDRNDACFVSNHPTSRAQPVTPGVHGLSNADLDAPWPKTRRAVESLQGWIAAGGNEDFSPLFAAFADEAQAPDAGLPDTGVGIEVERLLSPLFVRGERYGTRATTVIALEHGGGGCIVERRFGPGGLSLGQATLRFDPTSAG